MIYKVINIIFTSVIQKSLPILMGIFVMNYYGKGAFSEFSLFLTAIASIVVFVSAGMVPALIKSIVKFSNIDEQRKSFESYLISAFILWAIVSFIFLLGGYFNVLPKMFDSMTYNFLIVSMSMIIILFSLSIMQALGFTATSLNVSVINALILTAGVGISSFIEFDYFLDLYTLIFIFMAVNCLITLSKNDLFILKKIKIMAPFKLVSETFKQSGTVFVPNIIWMLAVFQFHIYVSSNIHTSSFYASFAIGYQWLTFIVFIPGALAPLVISSFSTGSFGLKKAYLLSLTYFTFGVFLCSLFYIFNEYSSVIYGHTLSVKEVEIVLFVLLSGAIAGANAPLMQFLIGISKAYYIGVAAILWAGISVIPQLGLNITVEFHEIFFSAYLVSYFTLFIIAYQKNKL
jgi:hypothetical protein